MNYFVLFIIALVGIGLGYYLARLRRGQVSRSVQSSGFIREQQEKKKENKRRILEFLQQHGKIQNNDVEKLTGVSNATAERYLDELEKEGKLIQYGRIGHNVFYTLK